VPLVDIRRAPGIVFPDSRSTVVSTIPGTSVLSVAASRPFNGNSTMRFESTTSLMVAEETSTVGDSPETVTVSASVPSSIEKLTVRFWFACSSTPVR
jgi:hypothetical protein